MTIISESASLFQEKFSADVLRNERFRFLILIIVMVLLFMMVFTLTILYDHELSIIFKQEFIFSWVFLLIALLFIRSLVIQFVLSRRQNLGRPLHPFQRYINAFFEVSVPSLAIIMLTEHLLPAVALLTPAAFLYFLFILLSILEMDWLLSVFTGAVAGIQYFSLSLHYLSGDITDHATGLMDLPAPFIAKSIILLMCGIVAGLITRYLKQRVIEGYRLQSEQNRLQNLFGQQVSPEIVEELIQNQSGLKSRMQFVCILFLDIRGFTAYCRNRSPVEIVRFQNDVFSFMIDIIIAKHGIINQFLGDGFMATFGAPLSGGNDCQNAVDAAIQIYNEVKLRSDDGRIPPTEIGIGIHAGEVVTGNVGTTERQQYSITGTPVIIAARLEQLNKQLMSHVLISQDVLDHLDNDSIPYQRIGPVEIRGMDQPLEVIKLA